MISGIIKVEASIISRGKAYLSFLDLDYPGYHKNRIQSFKIQGQTKQVAASLETIQVLALFGQRCITHTYCAWYNLQM